MKAEKEKAKIEAEDTIIYKNMTDDNNYSIKIFPPEKSVNFISAFEVKEKSIDNGALIESSEIDVNNYENIAGVEVI